MKSRQRKAAQPADVVGFWFEWQGLHALTCGLMMTYDQWLMHLTPKHALPVLLQGKLTLQA